METIKKLFELINMLNFFQQKTGINPLKTKVRKRLKEQKLNKNDLKHIKNGLIEHRGDVDKAIKEIEKGEMKW